MFRTQRTQAQIDAYRDRTREAYAGRGFKIDSNGYGLRVECEVCHDSHTLNPEEFMARHGHAPQGREADYEERTVNPDGTVNRVLYYL